jgi:hypothetical protein
MPSRSMLDRLALGLGTLALRLTYGSWGDGSRASFGRLRRFLPLVVLAAVAGGVAVLLVLRFVDLD